MAGKFISQRKMREARHDTNVVNAIIKRKKQNGYVEMIMCGCGCGVMCYIKECQPKPVVRQVVKVKEVKNERLYREWLETFAK